MRLPKWSTSQLVALTLLPKKFELLSFASRFAKTALARLPDPSKGGLASALVVVVPVCGSWAMVGALPDSCSKRRAECRGLAACCRAPSAQPGTVRLGGVLDDGGVEISHWPNDCTAMTTAGAGPTALPPRRVATGTPSRTFSATGSANRS